MGTRNRVGKGLQYRPARLHSLAELVPWNRSLSSLKFGLCPPPVPYHRQNFSLAWTHTYCGHHNSRPCKCFVLGVGEQIRRPGGHHIRPSPCGPPCATCLTSSTPRQQLTTCSPTVWWSAFIAASKMRSRPTGMRLTGWTTWPGTSWASAQRQEKTTTPHLLRPVFRFPWTSFRRISW